MHGHTRFAVAADGVFFDGDEGIGLHGVCGAVSERDARRAISVTERQRYILRVRTLARGVAQAYFNAREALGFPMLDRKRK